MPSPRKRRRADARKAPPAESARPARRRSKRHADESAPSARRKEPEPRVGESTRRKLGVESAEPADAAPLEPAAPATPPPSVANPRSVYALSRAALRQIDRLTAEHYGLPTIALMENAAAQLAGAALDLLDGPSPWAVIVCGKGNNGGDGLALARHLHNAGIRVGVLLAAPIDEYAGDAAVNLGVVRRMGVRVSITDARSADGPARSLDSLCSEVRPHPAAARSDTGLIVDALFGTGLDRPVEAGTVHALLIAAMNAAGQSKSPPTILAVDVPSGLDADTGRGLAPPPDEAVRADVTVTFVGLKLGFASASAREHLGSVMVAEIGCPMDLVRRLGRAMDMTELFKPPAGRKRK